jgi:hypothetical protein
LKEFTDPKTIPGLNASLAKPLYHLDMPQIEPPCVPYLGWYQTDLTFEELQNPETLLRASDSGLPMIYFDKWMKIADHIREMQRFQPCSSATLASGARCSVLTGTSHIGVCGAAGSDASYKFAADTNVQSFILLTPLLDEARAYARSLELEPRAAA